MSGTLNEVRARRMRGSRAGAFCVARHPNTPHHRQLALRTPVRQRTRAGSRVQCCMVGSGTRYTFSSRGDFLTPLWTGPDPPRTAFASSRTAAQVTIRPDHLHDANVPTDQRSTTRWFDVSAFSSPAPGRFGTAAKASSKIPDLRWSMSVWPSTLRGRSDHRSRR